MKANCGRPIAFKERRPRGSEACERVWLSAYSNSLIVRANGSNRWRCSTLTHSSESLWQSRTPYMTLLKRLTIPPSNRFSATHAIPTAWVCKLAASGPTTIERS